MDSPSVAASSGVAAAVASSTRRSASTRRAAVTCSSALPLSTRSGTATSTCPFIVWAGIMRRWSTPAAALDIFPYWHMIAPWHARRRPQTSSTLSPSRAGARSSTCWLSRSDASAIWSIALECAQPSVSKHLRVLSDVGLVRARREGKRVLYRTNAEAIKPLHDWTSTFQQLWRQQLSRVKARAEAK